MNKKNSSRVNCITLTTDFGVTDEYVGVMKGVIRSIAPDVPVIDITHAIGPQNIRHGAYIIHAAFAYFPENSLHMIIVDPGVGSDRRIVLARISGHLFLAPDNGILSLLLEKETYEAAYEVTCDHLFLSPLSNTFHGRDIFAPVAAHLTGSIAPHEVGTYLPQHKLTRLTLPQACVDLETRTITGAVIAADHFGNLMTNIHQDTFKSFQHILPKSSMTVSIAGHTLHGIQESYAQSQEKELLALFGSRGYLEISMVNDNAADSLSAVPDEQVTVKIFLKINKFDNI